MNKQKTKWCIEISTFSSFKVLLNQEEIKFRDGMGFDPISGIIISVGGLVVVLRIIRSLLKDTCYGGYIIDTTSAPIFIKEMPAWERHQVLIITKDGQQTISFEQDNSLEKAIEFIDKLG